MYNTMNYAAFKSHICDNIHSYLPRHYEGGSVRVIKVRKSGDVTLDSLIIEDPGNIATPNIFLEEYYMHYAEGMPMEEILNDIADFRTEFETPEDFDLDPLMCKAGLIRQFDKVRDKIVPRLVNYEKSKVYLGDKAFKLIEDLAVTYHIYISGRGTDYSTAVTRDMLRCYGVSVEEIHKLALRNMKELLPFWFRSLDTLVAETLIKTGDEERLETLELKKTPDGLLIDDGTMVISNSTRLYGAAVMLIPEVMDIMGRVLGKDLYIIPSSIHEVILRPKCLVDDVNDLRKVVKEINRTLVDKEERLSDNIYTYDFENHVPVICRQK